MSHRRVPSPGRGARHSRFVFLLSVFTLVVSLMTPMLTLTASDAAAQGTPPNCDEGYVASQDGTECVPADQQQQQQQQQQPQCAEGEVLDPNTNSCVPATVPPQQASAYLQIAKFDCPPIMDWSQATYQDLQQNCAPNQAPVSISVTTMNNEGSTESITDGFTWGPFLAGQAQITETVNPGYDTPWIGCSDSGAPSTASRTDSTTWPLTDNTTSYCEIYNIHLVGSVTIYKWQCDDGTEYGRELEYYQGSLPDQQTGPCETEHLNIPIHLMHNGPQQDTTTQANGTQFNNIVPFPDGAVQVYVDEPDGFGDPMVFCGFTNDVQPQQAVPATGAGIALQTGVAPFDIQCNWYDIPIQPNSITIYKWLCDPGTQYGQDLTYYTEGPNGDPGPCEQEHLNIPISLIDGAPNSPHDTTTQANGTQFDDVVLDQNGSFQVKITEPQDFGDPMVFCATLDQDTPQPVTVTDGTITITPTGQPFTYQCNWYDIPGGTTTTGTTGTIVIEKYWCPEGLSFVQAPTRADMQAACQEQPTTGANFSLEGPASAPQTWPDQQPSGPSPQSVSWQDLPEGDYTVTENGLGSGWISTVYCHASNGQPDGAAEAPPVNGPGVTQTLQPGYTIDCAWFNQPSPTTGNSITIYKWQCDDGTEYGRELEYYQGSLPDQQTGPCETEHLNIPISLIDGNGPRPQPNTTQANGTQFDDVVLDQNGSFQVKITEPDGYGAPMVFCATLDQDTPQPVTVTDGTITITPTGQPFTYQCNWYDIPGQGNSITVYKWQCQPGTEYGQTQQYYTEGPNGDPAPCETEHLNIPISLIHGGPQQDTTTQANGTQFDNVVLDQNGSFQIAITEPAGYGEPMVFCASIDTDTQSPVTATNGTFTITPGSEPFSWQCNVYDIPTAGYQIDLYKYVCAYTVDRNGGLPDLGTNPDCKPGQGFSFTLTANGTTGSAYTTDPNGQLSWTGVEGGPWTLTEGMVSGYDDPKVFCGPPQSAETPQTEVNNLSVFGTLDETQPHIICYWFNFELPTTNGRITVYKYQCPPGTTSTDFGVLSESCTTPHNGIDFNLSGNGVDSSASTVGGAVDWMNLDNGTYTVTETTMLPGYGPSLVWCGNVMQDGVDIDPANYQFDSKPVTNSSIQLTIDNPPQWIVCHWYNFPTGPGEITIYKWTCPAGYDLGAWGADPTKDCTQATNGVTFTLDQPMGVDLQTNTGDSIDGAVYFGGLDPGSYRVTETVPANIDYVFVLDCTGTDIPKVHQYPLSWGNKLDINVAGGDKIVCQWYNVPKPEKGWVTVTKYVCTTKTFVDKVYCQVYEKGQSIELVQVNGNVSKGVGITNAGGTYTWQNLDPGAYTVKEQGMVPCKMTASMVDGKGNAIVQAGKGTMINVYNCTSTPGKVPPGKVPTKYPNTGVPPESASALSVSRLQGEPTGTPSAQDEAASEAFYQVDCINGTPQAGTPSASTPETEATAPPIEAEPTETPAAATQTPASTPTADEGGCERGAIPQHLSVASVGIDADVEYLEIVDGLMEQPSGPDKVAWYKDTARLGETNNVVIAGHLNWWNVPEGVFYNLQDMQQGDRIEVTGDDGNVYVYEVQTVTQESNLQPPGVDVIGPTDQATLTLITCGGDWNADIAEYDHRTVVRATLVETHPADTSGA